MLKVVLLFCRALCYDNNIVFGFSLFLMWHEKAWSLISRLIDLTDFEDIV